MHAFSLLLKWPNKIPITKSVGRWRRDDEHAGASAWNHVTTLVWYLNLPQCILSSLFVFLVIFSSPSPFLRFVPFRAVTQIILVITAHKSLFAGHTTKTRNYKFINKTWLTSDTRDVRVPHLDTHPQLLQISMAATWHENDQISMKQRSPLIWLRGRRDSAKVSSKKRHCHAKTNGLGLFGLPYNLFWCVKSEERPDGRRKE